MKKGNKGFTLIELLAVIFIISLLFGVSFYYVNNVINDSREKSKVLTTSSIKKSASLYVQEYDDNVVWKNSPDGNKSTCVSVSDLVKFGYIKPKQEENTDIKSVKLTKQNNGVIYSEVYNDPCTGKSIPIPTSKEYCNQLEYKGSSLTLAKVPDNLNDRVQLEDNSGKNAGIYTVRAALKSKDDVWRDGSTVTKTITCTIKKAFPTLILDPPGEGGDGVAVGATTTASVYSHEVGGKLTVRSSNTNYVVGSIESSNIVAGGSTTLTVKHLATNTNVLKYLYVTLTPTDDFAENYYTTTAVYTIGTVKLQEVNLPTCKNALSYRADGRQEFLEGVNKKAYTLSSVPSDETEYKVKATLKYGYVWQEGNTVDPKYITCKIKQIPTLKIISVTSEDNDPNIFKGSISSGTLMKTKSVRIKFESNTPGTIVVNEDAKKFIKFEGLSSDSSGTIHSATITGTNVTVDDALKKISFTLQLQPDDQKNFMESATTNYELKVIPNEYLLTYYYKTGSHDYSSSHFDTQQSIYWNRNVDISFNFKLPTRGNGIEYMLLGTLNNKSNTYSERQLVLKINENGKLVINIGEKKWETIRDISYGTKLSLSFQWKADEQKFNVVIKNGKTSPINISGNTSISGSSTRIYFGTTRGAGVNYGDITIDAIKIGSYKEYGKSIGTIPGINSTNKLTFFDKELLGWNTDSKGKGDYLTTDFVMPLKRVDWYAFWGSPYYIKYILNSDFAYFDKKPPEASERDKEVEISNPKTTNKGEKFIGWTASTSNLSSDAQSFNPSNKKFESWNGTTKVRRIVFKNLGVVGSTVTMNANWGPETYTLTYVSIDGDGCNKETQTADYGSTWGELCIPSRKGYAFAGWYTATTDGEKVTEDSTVKGDLTVYARWDKAHLVKIKLNVNGGTLHTNDNYSGTTTQGNVIKKSSGTDVIHTISYGGTLDKLASYNIKNYINISYDGFHAKEGAEWILDGGTTTYAQGGSYNASDFCDSKDNDCTAVLKVNWVPNKIYVKLHVNGGTLRPTAYYTSNSEGYVIDRSKNTDIIYTFSYGGKNRIKLASYNSDGYINIYKYGSYAKEKAEWFLSGGTETYAQGVSYGASDFCNATNNSCTAVLKVNWTSSKVRVRLHPNQGSLSTTSSYNLYNGYIQKTLSDGSKTIDFYTIPSGGSITRLASPGYIKFVRNGGWHINKGREWVSYYTGRTFAAGDYIYYYNDFHVSYNGDSYDTLKVNWEKDSDHTVTYNANGGANAPSPQPKYDGQPLTLSWLKPTKSDSIFKEWNTDPNGNGTVYHPGQIYKGNTDLKLYAQWTKLESTNKITLKITYDAAGGTPKTANPQPTITYGNVTSNDRITDLKKVENLFNKPSSVTGTLVGDAVKGEEWVISGTNITLNQNSSYDVKSLMQWGNCSGNSCHITLCVHWDANSLLIGTYNNKGNVGFWIYSPNPDYQIRSLYVGSADDNFVNNVLVSSYKDGYETMKDAGIYTPFSKGGSISGDCIFTDYSFSCYTSSSNFFGSKSYGAICVELENITYPGRYYYCHAVSNAGYDGAHTSFGYGAVRSISDGVEMVKGK